MPNNLDAVEGICSDARYFKEIPSCACVNSAAETNRGIQTVVDMHNKDIEGQAQIAADNKDKTKKLGIAITSYTNQLRKTGFFTDCKYDHETAERTCRDHGYHKSQSKIGKKFSDARTTLHGSPSVATGWIISHENPGYKDASCGLRTETGIGVLDSLSDTISAQNHAWCWYSDAQIDQMKALRQKVLAEEAQYKHIIPPPIAAIDVSGLTNTCCTNSIIVKGDSLNVHDVTQICKNEVKQQVVTEMHEKGLGTPGSPKTDKLKISVVTFQDRFDSNRDKLLDILRDKFHITIDVTTPKGKAIIALIILAAITLVVVLVVIPLVLLTSDTSGAASVPSVPSVYSTYSDI